MINIYRITDYAVVLTILDIPAIKEAISEDTAPLEVPDLVNEFWLGAEHEGNVIGCYRVHKMGAVLYQVHARIMPDHRKYAEEASHALLKYCADYIQDFECLMCYVPIVHKNVLEHAIRVGFQWIGNIPKSYLKNGKVISQDVLAITKEQILCQQPPLEQ